MNSARTRCTDRKKWKKSVMYTKSIEISFQEYVCLTFTNYLYCNFYVLLNTRLLLYTWQMSKEAFDLYTVHGTRYTVNKKFLFSI